MPGATERKRQRTRWQPTGTWIRPVKRLAIYLRDHFRCLLCGDDLHGALAADITLDHFKPLAKGGDNEATNLYTCCRDCNSARGSAAIAAPQRDLIRWQLRRSLVPFLELARTLREGERMLYPEDAKQSRTVGACYPSDTPYVTGAAERGRLP